MISRETETFGKFAEAKRANALANQCRSTR